MSEKKSSLANDKSIPLYKQIANHLREQIMSGKLRPGDRVPSEKEIASYFNVSQITSKQALALMSDENLVIRLKGKGTFVAGRNGTDILHSIHSGFNGIVGIVFPSIMMPIESMLFFQVQSRLHERGYQTLIRVTEDIMEKEVEAIRMFQLFGVRGFIIFPVMEDNYNEEILKLSLDRFPHVLVDRYLPSITNSSVTSDNLTGTMSVVDYLLGAGHEHIALITQEDSNSNTREREAGFERVFLERSLPIDKKYWLYLKRHTKEDDAGLKEKIKAFFHTYPRITAVITIDTVLARLVYASVYEIGKRIPDELTLVSFDDPKLPFVPYIEQNIPAIAEKAVEMIIHQMEGAYAPRREIVPVTFVRDVTYPAPEGL
ncbi:GntR family transcriptional regulator [Cohnella cellulosilytica]|uniref:GntR family transcriptional regulator n=1 Tax=Cohnella cellulosilytica TaxID=986710 RepID=A0ABW2FHW9_9BACL